jgi:hypothetical protein
MTSQSLQDESRPEGLARLQPAIQLLIMLGFALAVAGIIVAAAYLLPESLTGAATMP